MYILARKYLEKKLFYFIKVTKDNKKTNEEIETISNSKKRLK